MTTHRISATAPDHEINAAVAEFVAGWLLDHEKPGYGFSPAGTYLKKFEPFATSADAILALLESSHFNAHISLCQTTDTWTVVLVTRFTRDGQFKAEADTLPKSLCLALLAAHGFTITSGNPAGSQHEQKTDPAIPALYPRGQPARSR